MKILYLHGLESSTNCAKVQWLRSQGHEVLNPEIDYKAKGEYNRIKVMAKHSIPDLIIGSSMGGYFAYALGTWTNIPIVLLNPALHSRQFEPDNVRHGLLQPRIHCLLGANDTVINPYDTHKILQFEPKCEFMIKKHGHRTPVGMFKKIINSI